MKLGLINSAWLGTPIGTARGIQLTKEIGFDTIDIFADPLEISPQEKRTIRETCAAAELPVVSVVCCALGIADFNTPVRRFHIHRAKSYLALAKDGADEILRLAGRIAHAHLSDCDGRKHGDLPPGRGIVDFPPYLKALAESGFDGTVSIELEYSPEPGKIVDWVREAYQSA